MARGVRAAVSTITGITSAVMGAFASAMSAAPSASNTHGAFSEMHTKPTQSRGSSHSRSRSHDRDI